jgi:hypothetical protein
MNRISIFLDNHLLEQEITVLLQKQRQMTITMNSLILFLIIFNVCIPLREYNQ